MLLPDPSLSSQTYPKKKTTYIHKAESFAFKQPHNILSHTFSIKTALNIQLPLKHQVI